MQAQLGAGGKAGGQAAREVGASDSHEHDGWVVFQVSVLDGDAHADRLPQDPRLAPGQVLHHRGDLGGRLALWLRREAHCVSPR